MTATLLTEQDLEFAYSMSVMLLTEQHLDILSLQGGCTGSSDSIRVKYQIVGNHMSRLICALLGTLRGIVPTLGQQISVVAATNKSFPHCQPQNGNDPLSRNNHQ